MEAGTDEKAVKSRQSRVVSQVSTVYGREAVMGDREPVKSRQSCVGSLRHGSGEE